MNDALYKACLSYQEEWINSFYPLEEHVFSARHERKMKALFSKIRNNKYHRLTKNAVRAIIIAAIILSLAITAFAIEAVKAYRAYNLSVGTVYNAVNRNETIVKEDLYIGYIPEGYSLIKDINISHAILKQYMTDDENLIVIEKYVLNSEAILNTEIHSYEVIEYNNTKYFYYIFNNFNCIIWNNDGFTYNINSSNLSKEELMLIAFSTS